MSKFNDEYFFVTRPRNNERLPYLVPDSKTEGREFRYKPQPAGSPPLVFRNDMQPELILAGRRTVAAPVLFAGTDLVVNSTIRERLLRLAVPNLSMHPTVYIDEAGVAHQDYWHLMFTQRLDCWDRTHSDYDDEEPPLQLGGHELYEVYRYSLDEQALGKLPLQQRLIFKMGAATTAEVLCHASVVEVLAPAAADSIKFKAIKER